ncbi:MAG: TetR/AcrR family transcriptional regulator [Cyclobacteriaceae bacterium]
MEIKERQLEIIAAAGEILTTSGISGLTTKSLAAKMNFSESALYRHFKDKEDIILTMLKYLAYEMDNRFTNLLADVKVPEEKFKALFNSQFDFFSEKPHFLIAIFSDGMLEESKSTNKAITAIMEVTKGHLMKIIQEGQKQEFTKQLSAEELVHIIMGSFRLHMLQWRMSGFAFDLKQKGNKLMANLLTLINTN